MVVYPSFSGKIPRKNILFKIHSFIALPKIQDPRELSDVYFDIKYSSANARLYCFLLDDNLFIAEPKPKGVQTSKFSSWYLHSRSMEYCTGPFSNQNCASPRTGFFLKYGSMKTPRTSLIITVLFYFSPCSQPLFLCRTLLRNLLRQSDT